MIRRLDPEADVNLYRQCWGWFEALPAWAKDGLAPYSVDTFTEFLELAKGNRANIGVFHAERMVAVITLQFVQQGIYELHFSSMRRPPRELILEAMVNVIRIGFEELNAQMGFSFTPSYDRGIIQMIRAAGMRQDGVEKIQGTSRGRAVKWRRSIITRADYERDTKADTDADGNRAVFADRQFDHNEYSGREYTRYQPAA